MLAQPSNTRRISKIYLIFIMFYAAVIANRHRGFSEVFLQIVCQSLRCFSHSVDIHAVGACTNYATQTTGAKRKVAVECIFDFCIIDSLHYSVLTSNTELHRLLLDCNETEQEIIIRTARELKATLVSLGI